MAYNFFKGLEGVKGRIPLRELILALKKNERDYVSKHLRGDKSESAKLWRKLRKVTGEKEYDRIEKQFFEKLPKSKRTTIKQELYWKIIDILDMLYFRNTLISKILTVSRLYQRFAGRGNKDAVINPYEWIPADSVFWTQVPPWWWYEYSASGIDVTNVPIDSKHVLDHINKILEFNTHTYRVASALRFIPTFKIDIDRSTKLISHISEFIHNNFFPDVHPHYVTVWLIGVYALVFSKLGFIKTVFDLINGLTEIVPIMQELRKYVEIEYELKYEDDMGFMFSVPKIVELISASSYLNVFGNTTKMKEVIDSVVGDPSSSQIVMLQVRAGAWYILNGYYDEGKECLNKAVRTMSVERYPINTKSVYIFSKIWLSLVEKSYDTLDKKYLPMLKELRSDPANIIVSHLCSWMVNMELGRYRQAVASAETLYAYSLRHEMLRGVSGAIRWFTQNIHRQNQSDLWEGLKNRIVETYYTNPAETNIERGIPLLRYIEIKRRGILPEQLPHVRLVNAEKIESNARRVYGVELPREELLSFASSVVLNFKNLLYSLRN